MATDWVKKILVRLDATDAGALRAALLPGESAAACMRRCLSYAVTPADVLLLYRKPPIFTAWFTQGPMSALLAEERAIALKRKGYEIQVQQTIPAPIPPHHPEAGEE